MKPSAFLGLRTVVYHVSDLARAKDWYRELLGIEPYFDTPYYVGFNVGGLCIGGLPGDKGRRLQQAYRRKGCVVHKACR